MGFKKYYGVTYLPENYQWIQSARNEDVYYLHNNNTSERVFSVSYWPYTFTLEAVLKNPVEEFLKQEELKYLAAKL